MRTPSLFVLIFVISALTSAVQAGQTIESEGQGTGAEPECDHAAATNAW